MRRGFELVVVLLAALLVLGAHVARAQDDDDDDEEDQATLVKALPQAKVSLEQALLAGEQAGTPISAKFEVEEGKLQLSVYTMKADKFSEVVVDHVSGKVAKIEAITASKGYQAFSVVPSLKDGHPVAEVSLARGLELKTMQIALK